MVEKVYVTYNEVSLGPEVHSFPAATNAPELRMGGRSTNYVKLQPVESWMNSSPTL